LVRLALGEDGVSAIAARLGALETEAMELSRSPEEHRRAVGTRIVAMVRASGWTRLVKL
jgi:hypothetical protein